MNKEDLIGIWKSDSDKPYGDVTMEFNSDGSLTYTTLEGDKRQIINLVFWLEDNYLFTDQPSSPKVEKTKVSMGNGKMILDYSGKLVTFSKV